MNQIVLLVILGLLLLPVEAAVSLYPYNSAEPSPTDKVFRSLRSEKTYEPACACAYPGEVTFADADGNPVASYTNLDDVYIKVVDPSLIGVSLLEDALEIGGQTFDLELLSGAANDTFITRPIFLGELVLGTGNTITATYTDPLYPLDTSTVIIGVIEVDFEVEAFLVVPVSDPAVRAGVAFTYEGNGLATVFSVTVYDLTGKIVWDTAFTTVSEVVWNGTNREGEEAASGPYIYVIAASDETRTYTNKGAFIKH